MRNNFRRLFTRHLTTTVVHLGLLMFTTTSYAQAVDPLQTGQVQLLNGSYYKQLQDLHEGTSGYLSFFQPDDLLYEFRKQAGLSQPAGANDLGGFWEGDSNDFGFVRGHTAGHYLTAASRMYALTGNTTYLNNVNDIVTGLADVQTAFNNNGYLAALPESVFTVLENDQMSFPTAWVPYYTQHKIMAGLNDAHTHTGNQQALDVVFDNAQYFVDRVNALSPSVVERMVKTHENQGREFGGMNELLTDLYVKADALSDSRAQGFLDLANVFNNRTYMQTLAAGIDALPGTHANTHIPQAVGWAKYGRVANDQTATAAAQNYWDIVTRDHTFVTGGNSYGEWYRTGGQETGTDGSLLSWDAAETCNVYNMLKLTGELIQQDPQQKYAAYAENALINQILPSMDPVEGVTTYFMSLKPGHFKTYHTGHVHDGSMWCCAGSGMENPTRYTDLTYFKDADALYVNTFMPSQVDWTEKGITLTQEGDSTTADETMRMTVNTDSPTDAELNVRIPSWANGDVLVTINGQAYQGDVNRGEYLALNRQWQDGDEVEVTLDKNLYLRRSRDDPNMISVYYGAVLLAGGLGTDGLPGNNQKAVGQGDYAGVPITVSVPDIDAINADPSSWLVPVSGEEMHFELYDDGVATGIIFKPFYETHHERYSVYWKLDAPAGTRTWRGGGSYNTVQEGLNWDIAPAPGDSLQFDGDLTTSVDNNYASGTAFNDITFAPNAAGFTVSGNRITLQGSVSNLSTQTQTVNTDLNLAAGDHTFNASGAPLVIGGQVSGDGNLVKTGDNQLTLLANNNHHATVVNDGELHVGNGGTTGSLGTGDVTLANNATLAFNRSDNATLASTVSGNGNLRKLGAGELNVIKPQLYTGQTIIEEGTLRLDTGSAGNGTFSLDFDTQGGTVKDTNGEGTGFTRRLAGTADPTNDANLDIDQTAGTLSITSGGASDFYGENGLQNIEAPGINLSDLGIDTNADFTITANFQDAPSAANYRQFGVYVGDSAYRLLRGGYLSVDAHNIFGVNNTGSSANDSNLTLTSTGAPTTGGDVDVVVTRIAGVFTITVNGVNATPSSQLTELNGLSDLTLGVFSLHTSSSSGDFTVPLTSFTITSPDLPADEIFQGMLPTATDVVIAAGATLDLNDMDQTLGSLDGEAGSGLIMGNAQANTLTINGTDGTTQFDGTITGQGNLVKAGNSTLKLGGANSFSGSLSVQEGILALLSAASITNASSIDIQPDATLALELSGPGNLDLLNITGNFSANGTLQVTLDPNAPSPQPGDSYDLMDFASATGAFITLKLPTLSQGLAWDTSNLLTTGVLSVDVPVLQGDLDGDGFVGITDLNLVLSSWNNTVQDGHPADPTSDNFVGIEDLNVVLGNWNTGTPPNSDATSNIPEPTSFTLLTLSSLFLCHRHRPRLT